jgi:hypothetical protein
MSKPRTIEGRWWLQGEGQPPHFGTLSFDSAKGLDLNVKIPQSRTPLDLLQSAVEKPKVPKVIYGKDAQDHDVTLFGCSAIKWSLSAGLDSFEITDIGAGILNCRVHSWEEARFPFAQVRYTLLTRWLGRYVRWENDKEQDMVKDGCMCLRFKAHEELEFELSSDVRLRIAGTCFPRSSGDVLRLEWEHSIWFLFARPLPPRVILDGYALVLLRLLCLLTGERVFIEDLNFWDGDPFKPGHDQAPESFELLRRTEGVAEAKRDVHATNMIASFDEIAADFSGILKRWFECHEKLRPVLDLYFAVVSNWVLTDESRFLFLAQALEVYHARSTHFSSMEGPEEEHEQRLKAILETAPEKARRWLERKLAFSNQKDLSRRIDEFLKAHKEEATRLTAKIGDFAAKVRVSRNYYTHYSEELLKDGKVATGLELRRIVYALCALLEICLLKELGIGGKPVERILERNASIVWGDLEKGEATGPRFPQPRG